MKEFFSYTKLFTILLTTFFIFGLIGCYFNQEIFFSFLSFLILSLLIYFLNFDFKKALILYLIFFSGLTRANQSLKIPSILDNIHSNNAVISGQIISSKNVSNKNNKIKFFLRADKIETENKKYENKNIKFLISIEGIEEYQDKISIGDYINLKGKLRHANNAYNPHQFDYRKYLINNDVKNILYADTLQKIKEADFNSTLSDKWYFVLNKFENIRNKILEKHSKNIKSPRLEVLGGIVFGNETINPDEEIKENFKNSGLLHLLAASGLNVALIFGIWWWIASLLRIPYNLSVIIGAVFVIIYTFMTGFPPSILRASIMLLFILFGKIIDRTVDSLALIFFAALIILIFSPKMIFDVGFQLSFIVTIGLVVCTPVIMEKFEKLDKRYKEKYKNASRFNKYFIFLFSPSNIIGIISIPLIAQLFVIPLQMHYFNNFAPFSLFANIAIVPFIGILSFIGFISSIFALIPFLNEPIIYIFDSLANPLLGLLLAISEFFSSFKFSLITTNGLNLIQIFLFWTILILITLNLKYNFKNKKQLCGLLICFIVFAASFLKFDYFKNTLEIIMFDVENADSFLIKTPKNKYIMIDTGKKSYQGTSSAEIIINKYLKNERINNIEILILTHFDADHCSGATKILNSNKVKNILIQKETAKSQTSEEILKYLKENNLNYKIAKNNEKIYEEKDINIKTYVSNIQNDNESSIVTLLEYKNKNILFMADVGIKGYKNIKDSLPENIEIIKIGHHGAKDSISNEMIKNHKPKYALISTGYNIFNHPHFETIDILNKNNVKIVSTKNFGFSKIILKNDKEKLYYFDNSKKKLKEIIFKKPDYRNEKEILKEAIK